MKDLSQGLDKPEEYRGEFIDGINGYVPIEVGEVLRLMENRGSEQVNLFIGELDKLATNENYAVHIREYHPEDGRTSLKCTRYIKGYYIYDSLKKDKIYVELDAKLFEHIEVP